MELSHGAGTPRAPADPGDAPAALRCAWTAGTGLRGRGSSPAANRWSWAGLVCLPSPIRERTLLTKVLYPPRRNFALRKLLSCRCCPSPALCRVLPRLKIPPEHPHRELARNRSFWVGKDLRAHPIPTPMPRARTPSTRPRDAKVRSSNSLPHQVGCHPARNWKGVKARMKDAAIFQKQPKVEGRKISRQTITHFFLFYFIFISFPYLGI